MSRSHGVLAVIPARLESTRLPGKLLLAESGQPLIVHTLAAARRISLFDDVAVATDSTEIAAAVRESGGIAVLTGQHDSGTDRIREAVLRLKPSQQIIVNVQGDEPDITDEPIAALVAGLEAHPGTSMSTACTRFTSQAELRDPACVKVVCSRDGHALYFSRSVVPSLEYAAEGAIDLETGPWRRHVGLYAYRREFLDLWDQLPVSSLQAIESLEQLRPLEAGKRIHVSTVSAHPPGIDTRSDYDAFLSRVSRGQ